MNKTVEAEIQKALEESVQRVLLALKYKGIDPYKNDYIIENETVISYEPIDINNPTIENIGSNMTWKYFITNVIYQALHRVVEVERKEIKKRIPTMKMEENDVVVNPIFRLLNCYEIEASDIRDGKTFIDSNEATKLTKKIMGMWNKTVEALVISNSSEEIIKSLSHSEDKGEKNA